MKGSSCYFFALACFLASMQVHAADIGSCEPDPKGSSIYWPIATGKLLLSAVQDLKIQKERVSILQQKLELKDEKISFWQMQLETAEKALIASEKSSTAKSRRIEALEASATAWQSQAAKMAAERVWWMVGGIVAGVVIVGGCIALGYAIGAK